MTFSDNESSLPSAVSSPPRAKDPPEIALLAPDLGVDLPQEEMLCPHQEIEPIVDLDNEMPTLPTTTTMTALTVLPFEDAPQTQEWSSNSLDIPKKNRPRISYVNRGILASRTLFLHSDDEFDEEQEEELFLVGKVLSAPRKGVCDVFQIAWDRSSLPSSMTNYKLRSSVDRSDHEKVTLLRSARFYFDEKYPEGNLPPAIHSLTIKNSSKKKKSKRNTNEVSMVSSAKKARKRDNPPATGPPVMDSSPQRRSRVLRLLDSCETINLLMRHKVKRTQMTM